MRRWLSFAVVLLTLATPLRAQTLDDVLDRHAAAQGLSREAADERALHLVGQVTAFGLSGEMEIWSEAPLRLRSTLELGPLSVETGFDGQRGWLRDRNGTVRDAEGAELAGLLLDALLQSGGYALDRPPVPLRRALVESDDDPGTLEIRLQPLDGEPETLVLDAESHRLLGTRWHSGQELQETDYEDHRWVDGLLVAHRLTVRFGESMTLAIRIDRAERLPALGPDAYRPAVGAPVPAPRTDAFAIPMLGEGLHVLLAGVVDGEHEGRFLLDTGAGGNVLNRAHLDELGLSEVGSVEARGVAGTADAGFAEVGPVAVGGLLMPRQSWVTLDLSQLEPVFGDRLLGVLGYDLLARVRAEIDYETREVRFSASGSEPPHPEAVALPLRLDSNVPTVQIEVEGIEGWVHVDTGSDNTLDLTPSFVETHALLEDREGLTPSGLMGLGGTGYALQGELSRLRVGPWELLDLLVNFNQTAEGVLAHTDLAGILGAGVLKHFHCVFDYPQGVLWMWPNELPSPVQTSSPSGLAVERREGRLTVVVVAEDSPASLAGIRVGDELRGLNNRSVGLGDLEAIRRALDGEAGRVLKLHLRREGRDLHRRLRLPR